jgi:hypothetical protein
MFDTRFLHTENGADISDIDKIRLNVVSVGEVKPTKSMDEVVYACLSGDAPLLVDGLPRR